MSRAAPPAAKSRSSPARGPMLSRRRSLAIFESSTARRRSAPEYASTSPMLCVTRKRFAAGASVKPVRWLKRRDREIRVVVSGIETSADRRRAEVQFPQLFGRPLDVVRSSLEARGVAAELLSERDRHRILQMRAAHFQRRTANASALAAKELASPRAASMRAGCSSRSARRMAVG